MDAKKLTTFLVVTPKTQLFTVTTNAQNTLQHIQNGKCSQNISFFEGGDCVRRIGSPVPWHNGTMASPSLSAVLQKTTGQAYKNAVICLVLTG